MPYDDLVAGSCGRRAAARAEKAPRHDNPQQDEDSDHSAEDRPSVRRGRRLQMGRSAGSGFREIVRGQRSYSPALFRVGKPPAPRYERLRRAARSSA